MQAMPDAGAKLSKDGFASLDTQEQLQGQGTPFIHHNDRDFDIFLAVLVVNVWLQYQWALSNFSICKIREYWAVQAAPSYASNDKQAKGDPELHYKYCVDIIAGQTWLGSLFCLWWIATTIVVALYKSHPEIPARITTDCVHAICVWNSHFSCFLFM